MTIDANASIEALRTLALVGASGSGKTSLAEALLHASGAIGAMGSLRHAIRVLADVYSDTGNGLLILLRQFLVTLAFGGVTGH